VEVVEVVVVVVVDSYKVIEKEVRRYPGLEKVRVEDRELIKCVEDREHHRNRT
jgi:hypothetical protein